MPFDPDAAAPPGSGLFGLGTSEADARFVVLPVPFDATTSYRDGARHGPAVVLAASRQVDLHDLDFGRPWEEGIALRPLASPFGRAIARANADARRHARPVIEAGGDVAARPALRRALARVNALGDRMVELVHAEAARLLSHGKVPIVLGGDHSTPFGAIEAYAARYPGLGILHVDAHADLRDSFEGFTWSHASIMHNVVHRIGRKGGVATLVQVAIRDVGESELALVRRRKGAKETEIVTFFDSVLDAARLRGKSFARLADAIVARLPEKVYLSLDIDGLQPTLCPDTGTPVPGGLSWAEGCELLRALVRAGKHVVGGDLCEVAPSPRTRRAQLDADWNGNVGARLLYKAIGAMARSTRA